MTKNARIPDLHSSVLTCYCMTAYYKGENARRCRSVSEDSSRSVWLSLGAADLP